MCTIQSRYFQHRTPGIFHTFCVERKNLPQRCTFFYLFNPFVGLLTMLVFLGNKVYVMRFVPFFPSGFFNCSDTMERGFNSLFLIYMLLGNGKQKLSGERGAISPRKKYASKWAWREKKNPKIFEVKYSQSGVRFEKASLRDIPSYYYIYANDCEECGKVAWVENAWNVPRKGGLSEAYWSQIFFLIGEES